MNVPPIVVCTHPRSGSSLTCGLLHEAGIWTGPSRQAGPNNPNGYFENENLMALNRLRRAIRWPDVLPILDGQGWQGERWLVKIKASFWRQWLPLEPIYIKVRRNSAAILASHERVRKRGKQQMPRPEAKRKISHYVRILKEIPGYTLWPEKLVRGDDRAFRKVWRELGLPWSSNFLDRELWHFK
jgi:hypothetical protein